MAAGQTAAEGAGGVGGGGCQVIAVVKTQPSGNKVREADTRSHYPKSMRIRASSEVQSVRGEVGLRVLAIND